MEAMGLFRAGARSLAPHDGGGDTDLAASRVRVLTRDPTSPSMGGSLVMDARSEQLGGMLFGRDADQLGLVGLMVPGRDILDGLIAAERGGLWRAFDKWGAVALMEDILPPLKLHSGGYLLIVAQIVSSLRELVFNQVLRLTAASVDILVGEEKVLTIRRTLSAALQGFSIYVTIDEDGGAPVALVDDDPNGCLAVRLSELSGLPSQIPMEIKVDVNDRRDSTAHGNVQIDGPDAVRLAYHSGQTVGLSLSTTISMTSARLNAWGLRITARNKSLHGTLHGRLQFPRYPARATPVSTGVR